MTGPPDPPGNCTIQSESTETVRVACQPGSDHGFNQSYSLLVFNRSQMLVENTTLVEPSFSISGLESGREYFGIIYSFNVKGRSHLRNLTLHSINEPMGQPTIAESGDKRATPLLTPTISTVIGVVAAVLSITLLIMGIVCRPKVCRSRTPSPMNPLADSTHEMECYHQFHHPSRAKRQPPNGPGGPNGSSRLDGPAGPNGPSGVTNEPLVIVGPMSSSTISDAAVTFPLDRFTSTNQQSQPFQFLWYMNKYTKFILCTDIHYSLYNCLSTLCTWATLMGINMIFKWASFYLFKNTVPFTKSTRRITSRPVHKITGVTPKNGRSPPGTEDNEFPFPLPMNWWWSGIRFCY